MDDTATTLRSDNLICLPGAGRSEALLGVSLLYKAESAQTGGRLVCAEITVPPRQGVPPHRHTAEDEAFYVLAGRVAMGGDEGAPVVLEAGSFFYGPRGQVHGFACDGAEPARLLVFVAPGSGIERMFGELAELTRVRGSSPGLCGGRRSLRPLRRRVRPLSIIAWIRLALEQDRAA